MIERFRNASKSLIRTGVFARILLGFDGLVLRFFGIFPRAVQAMPTYDVCIVAAPGAGNIGDQALLEAALDNSCGRVVVIVRDGGSTTLPARFGSRTEVLPLASLLYGNPVERLRDLTYFIRVASRSRCTWIIGADTMDGAYNPLASVNRFASAIVAARLGSRTRVLGFSWNDKGTYSSIVSARIASPLVELLVRDPLSLERLKASGVPRAELCADIVFARKGGPAKMHGVFSWVSEQKRCGRRIAIINVSGLISSAINQTAEYEKLIGRLIRDDWAIVFLPHVSRTGNDDVDALKVLASAVSIPCGFLVDELLSPDQVHSLAGLADLVVTGRMHLAVLSILAGTYPITLATQGKVEGLYRIIGEPRLCVEPKPGFGGELVRIFDDLAVEGLFDTRVDVSVIEGLQRASSRNFA